MLDPLLLIPNKRKSANFSFGFSSDLQKCAIFSLHQNVNLINGFDRDNYRYLVYFFFFLIVPPNWTICFNLRFAKFAEREIK